MTVTPLRLETDDQLAIGEALATLENGGVVVFPTDTVYGLLGGIYHPQAYDRIFTLKRRDPAKPIALLAGHNSVAATNMLRALGMHLPQQALFKAGAATLVADPEELAPGTIPTVVSECQPGTVGVRIPAHDALQQLLEEAGGMVWATSVNASGAEPAVTSDEVLAAIADLDGDVDCVVLSSSYSRGAPSRVLRLQQGLVSEIPR